MSNTTLEYIESTDITKNGDRVIFSSTTFLKITGFSSIAIILLLCGLNYYFDIFGLFRSVKDRSLQVYHNERASKYLLSYHYIPENFNTVILGTSLSDNLDITKFNNNQSRYKIYNASMMGGNITEISALAQRVVDGGVKNIIFCISPYQLKETGFKETEFNDKLYFSSLGSKNLYEIYSIALLRKTELLPQKFPEKHINEFGTNFFTERYRVKDVGAQIRLVRDAHKNKPIHIDEIALHEFTLLIQFLKTKHVNLIAYFHPVPIELYQSKIDEHHEFQNTVKNILGDYGELIDFNTTDFHWFTSDYSNYIDNGHLSEKGQEIIAENLNTILNHGKSTISEIK